MARLQDYQTVTPATSDNLLIVQSQGQGLSTLNAVGQKIANDTTISSLNTTSKNTVGAINELKALAESITPQEYDFKGIILNSDGGTIKGSGTAHITMCNGIARIDFALMIETEDSTAHTYWGINRDYFRTLTGKIINVNEGGVFTYYKPDGTINADRQGYGGAFVVANQFWKPARVYKSGSSYNYGSWANTLFPVDSRMVGCCFGTYT